MGLIIQRTAFGVDKKGENKIGCQDECVALGRFFESICQAFHWEMNLQFKIWNSNNWRCIWCTHQQLEEGIETWRSVVNLGGRWLSVLSSSVTIWEVVFCKDGFWQLVRGSETLFWSCSSIIFSNYYLGRFVHPRFPIRNQMSKFPRIVKFFNENLWASAGNISVRQTHGLT
jgi:hypothetical protein